LPVTNLDLRRALARAEVYRLLAAADLPGPFVEVLQEALSAPGKLLGRPVGSLWPDFVLLCCAAASGGAWQMAVSAAAAAEFFALALDLLDEIEDDDSSPLRERHGAAVTLNCSTALLGLAFQALGPTEPARSADTSSSGANGAAVLAQAMVTATGGQHLDLTSDHGPALDQAGLQNIMARKSGALVGGCCALGATVGGAAASTVALYSAFGRHVGIAAQLDNDMHDLWEAVTHGAEAAKSDLRRGKQSAPLAFLRDTMNARGEQDEPALERELWETGALPYAWAVVQVHRAEALSLLERIAQTAPAPGLPLSLLRHLADSMLDQDQPPPDPGSAP